MLLRTKVDLTMCRTCTFFCALFFFACCLVATSPMSQVTLKAVDVMLNSSVWSFSSSEVFGCSFVSFNGTMLPVRSLKYLFEGKKIFENVIIKK